MLTDERYKQLMADVGMPESLSLLQALKQAALEGSIRNAPCERFCEATAFNAEIRKLKAKIKDADYLIGAFERGCDSEDYYMDIANYKGT